ncbi:MAG: type II toxin-antitoxin system RelE/ParE family toxin [Anaerolineae bacterium]|nr:type II toxin-antitoxin system RelE/ParE family toxin [Anaerolineae bacterium]
MATKVDYAARFEGELRRLRRKYKGMTDELAGLVALLKDDERPGDKIPQVGYDVYKVRLKNPSAGKGKSGGFRVIYYVRLADAVVLLTIYSKTQQTDIAIAEIRRVIEEYIEADSDEE